MVVAELMVGPVGLQAVLPQLASEAARTGADFEMTLDLHRPYLPENLAATFEKARDALSRVGVRLSVVQYSSEGQPTPDQEALMEAYKRVEEAYGQLQGATLLVADDVRSMVE